MNDRKLLRPEEVADLLGVTRHTLAVWRCEDRYDLPHVKIGRLVRYEANEVEAFIRRNARATT
jgi:excisionase family DNA binding protein